jgi:hypothetical protein
MPSMLQPVLARCRIGAQPHQRRGDREIGQLDQFAQQLGCFRAGIDDAAAGIDDRTARPLHQLDRLLDLAHVALQLRLVALLDLRSRWRRVGAGGELNVLRNIDDDRTRTAGLGDAERLVDDAGQFVDVLDQPVVLGAGTRDADRVAFLESVGADQRCRNLAGQADERNESISASCSGVTALVAPGPEVTSMTPTLPVERA